MKEEIMVRRKFVGQINLPDGKVDITDPCYGKDTWCRISANVVPGMYNCYSYIGKDKWNCKGVWINQIVFAEGKQAEIAEEKIKSDNNWQEIGRIGVDAGMAGFFDNKKDFDDNEWSEFCAWLSNKKQTHNPNNVYDSYIRSFDGRDGFWTGSGQGDGCYSVHAIKDNEQIIALEIRF